MRTPLEKADKDLKTALMLCLFMGLFPVGCVLFVYFSGWISKDWDKPVPVDVYRAYMEATRTLVYGVLPSISFGYLVVGYAIWHYRRKRKTEKVYDKIDV